MAFDDLVMKKTEMFCGVRPASGRYLINLLVYLLPHLGIPRILSAVGALFPKFSEPDPEDLYPLAKVFFPIVELSANVIYIGVRVHSTIHKTVCCFPLGIYAVIVCGGLPARNV